MKLPKKQKIKRSEKKKVARKMPVTSSYVREKPITTEKYWK